MSSANRPIMKSDGSASRTDINRPSQERNAPAARAGEPRQAADPHASSDAPTKGFRLPVGVSRRKARMGDLRALAERFISAIATTPETRQRRKRASRVRRPIRTRHLTRPRKVSGCLLGFRDERRAWAIFGRWPSGSSLLSRQHPKAAAAWRAVAQPIAKPPARAAWRCILALCVSM